MRNKQSFNQIIILLPALYLMSALDWSRLLKQQSEHIEQDDRIEQERKQLLKQLYRQQLEKMIKQQSSRTEDQKINDLRILKQASQRERKKIIIEERIAKQKQRQKMEMARTNIKSLEQRRSKLSEQNEELKNFYNQKYQKINTQMREQNVEKIRHREFQKYSLSKSYEKQMKEEKNKQLQQKLQDEKYVRLRQEIQQKKEDNRKFYINRGKSFRQNPQVYQLSKILSEEKQKIKINFLKKIEKQQPTSFLELQKPKIKEEEEKIKKIIETSKFNKNYFQNKAMRQKMNNQKQTAQYAYINKTIEQKNNLEKEMKLRELQRKKNMLKDELDRQIVESQTKSIRKNILDDEEHRINRSGNMPALPGLVKDYSNEKKFKILKSFLGGSSKTFSPYF